MMRARNGRRLLLIGLAAVITAGTLTSFSVIQNSSVTQALMPLPIQPFGPSKVGGMSTTELGQPFADYAVTEVNRGQRRVLSWGYFAPGFQVPSDADIPDGSIVGNVTLRQDLFCDSWAPGLNEDVWAQAAGPTTPYDWQEATTAVEGGPDEYLKSLMPPLPFLLRQSAATDTVWLAEVRLNMPGSSLNTVYSGIPWSPAQSAVVATTRQHIPLSSYNAICIDSPDVTVSMTTAVYLDGLFLTNPSAKGDTNHDGVDDATGLYPRWTAFQSYPDSRKSFQSPPSFPSDTGYVERFVQLQCYWLDLDGCWRDPAGTLSCDTNQDGYISAEESWQDYDLLMIGGIPAVDPDGDCLVDQGLTGDAAKALQPGHPVDLPSVAGTCPAFPWAGPPEQAPQTHSISADHDCDGLPDGIEAAWGSDPHLADGDFDGATDFVEMFQFTNPNVQDSDGDGYKDAPAPTYQNSNAAYDNCPAVSNPDQANSDGKGRWNGSQIPNDYASNPNKDKMGDACDPDDDNDELLDLEEPLAACVNNVDDDGDSFVNDGCPALGTVPETGDQCANTIDDNYNQLVNDGCPAYPDAAHAETLIQADPKKMDTDGDTVVDGVEAYMGSNVVNGGNVPPAPNLGQLKFFRACRWNLPAIGEFGGLWNAKYSSPQPDRWEMDPDGDGVNCGTGTGTDDDDDNGTGVPPAPKSEITDQLEIFGYNTNPANKDTDGDGCEDWIEIVDLNGNRAAEILDAWLVAQPAPPDSDNVRDINKNGLPGDLGDIALAVSNSQMVKTHAPCGPSPQPGPPNFRLSIDTHEDVGGTWCNPVDTQAQAPVVGGTHQVAICLTGSSAPPAAFQFDLVYNDQLNTCPDVVSGPGTSLDDNPDANAGVTTFTTPALGGGWDCNVGDIAEPVCDRDPDTGAGHGRASMSCLSLLTPTLPFGLGVSSPLAVVTFNAISSDTDNLELQNVVIGDGAGVELGSCNPALGVSVPCEGSGTPAAVGGLAEPPDYDPDGVSRATDSSVSDALAFAGIAAGALVLAIGGWYARRRRRVGL